MTDILTKPEWIPYYIQRMKGSKAYKDLRDFQFGWYSKLLVESADSDRPGYLPNDVGVLWKLAGAQTESFFARYGGIELLARHFNRTEDGLWIYNERMLEVLHEQGKKLTKRRRRCVAPSLLSDVFLLPQEIPAKTWEAFLEMRRKKRATPTEDAKVLIINKLLRFKAQGHNIQKILENSITGNWTDVYEPKQEQPNGNGRGVHGTGRANGLARPYSERKSYAEESCPKCVGSGWDSSSGKAVRCECWRKSNETHARGASAAGQQ